MFDCKLTSYRVLDELAGDHIKFVTLRKRNKKLLSETSKIPDDTWQKISLEIPKRKHKKCSVHESTILLPKCKNNLRQIIVKDHGRSEPTFIITSNLEIGLDELLTVYAKRWHIENKFSDLVSFFNLNSLSSPFMIRIHYHLFLCPSICQILCFLAYVEILLSGQARSQFHAFPYPEIL